VAVAMGVAAQDDSPASAARKGAQALTDLGRDIGIPALKQVPGIKQDDFPWIAATSRENLSNESNARTMTEADYLSILDQAWNAWAPRSTVLNPANPPIPAQSDKNR